MYILLTENTMFASHVLHEKCTMREEEKAIGGLEVDLIS